MSNYEQKYLTYKAKYFALKQKLSQNGGMPLETFGFPGSEYQVDIPDLAVSAPVASFPRPAIPTVRTFDTGVGTDPIPIAAPTPAPSPAPTTTIKETKTIHHILDPYYNPYLPALQYLQPKPYVRPYYEPAYSTDYLNYDPYEDKPRRASRRRSRKSSRKSSKKSSKRKSRK
jgi:hypothetical protein